MIRAFCIFISVMLLFPSLSLARKVTRMPIERLFKDADYVAVVCIESGDVVQSANRSCGAKYKAKVIDGIKGVFSDEVLQFGLCPGLAIGEAYLVFLGSSDRYHAAYYSGGYCYNLCCWGKQKDDLECGTILKNNWLLEESFGAMEIVGGWLGGEQVKVVTSIVTLPKILKAKRIQGKGKGRPPDTIALVSLKDLVSYLKRLNPAGQGRTP